MRKKPDPAIVPIQSKMFAHGISIKEACERADINPTTWSRWAAGSIPHTGKLRELDRAVDELIEATS